MKKNGFTLAEVLITLSIIGVVATMTLPALMTNTQEQQAFTGLKKGVNTLTEAAQMSNALAGWDFATAITTPTAVSTKTADVQALQTERSFTGLLAQRTSVDFAKGNAVPTDMTTEALKTDYKAVYFKDGTAVYYKDADVKNTAYAALQNDGKPLGYVVYFDTNGTKGPNIVSNCVATPAGALVTTSTVNARTEAASKTKCEAAKNRVLKDIYPLRVRGNSVDPEDYASVYVLSQK